MRRISICISILIFLLFLTLGNSFYLHTLTDAMAEPLSRAGTAASNGDWEQAKALTAQSREEWERHQFYFCITLRRTDTDAVELSFQQLEPLLTQQEESEYTTANASLITNIHLLSGTESLDLKNLL